MGIHISKNWNENHELYFKLHPGWGVRQGTWNFYTTSDGHQWGAPFLKNNSGNNGDEIYKHVHFPAGGYRGWLCGMQNSECGKSTVYVNNTKIMDAMDWYSASSNLNVYQNFYYFNFSTSGVREVRIKLDGKGSGSYYMLYLAFICFWPASS